MSYWRKYGLIPGIWYALWGEPEITPEDSRLKCNRYYYCSSYADPRCAGNNCTSCCDHYCRNAIKNHPEKEKEELSWRVN